MFLLTAERHLSQTNIRRCFGRGKGNSTKLLLVDTNFSTAIAAAPRERYKFVLLVCKEH
jgi:hypothetical protein